MRRLLLLCAIIMLVLSGIPSLGANDPLKVAGDKAAQLELLVHPIQWHWLCKIGDVTNGQNPALNDSSWKKFDNWTFTWGDEPTAWLRTKIVVPNELAGVSTAGCTMVFKCSVDDAGVLYVNGKEAQQFKGSTTSPCTAVLTQSAIPGQVFNIAIKGINTGGPGSLEFCTLEYKGITDYAAPVSEYLKKFYLARDIYGVADAKKREVYLSDLTGSMEAVNLTALKEGKPQVFTDSLNAASDKLKRLDELTSDLNAYLIGHAHIDMNWLWLWPETVETCKNTFTSVMNLMDQYPGFTFSQSQPATYFTMKEQHPDVFNRIKEMVKRGQWDATTASAWTEGDLNMESGEAIVRSIFYGKRFIKQEFGVDSVVLWEPDTFGHPWTMPQIAAKSGMKYYYFMRNGRQDPLFWWQSPDGSKILAYSFDGYNGDINQNDALSKAITVASRTGQPNYMRVYGVGDHGGGPTKEMLENAKKLQSQPNYPKVQFSTPKDYFETALKAKIDYPTYNGEINDIFVGCYTTHADAKRWNRESDNLLPEAETFSLLASNYGFAYPAKDFESSWRNTGFNAFHDILCGSAIHGSYEYSKDLYEKITAQGNSARNGALDTLSAKIKTDGPGVPVIVYNSLSWQRTDNVEVDLPNTLNGNEAVQVSDGKNVYPAQIIGDKVSFTARNIPSVGYKVFWLQKVKTAPANAVKTSANTIENQYYKVTINPATGTISDIYDKINARKVLADGGHADMLQILLERPHGMTAWEIGGIAEQKNLTGNSEVTLIEDGPVKATVSFDHEYDQSQFTQEVILYDGVPRIDLRLTADWQEVGNNSKNSPMLKVAFQTNLKNPKANFEIPFGSIERPTNGKEVPSQKWIDLSDANYGISLLNNCKYGFDVKDSTMRMTLLRSSYDPDPKPDLGMHEVTYSLYPHKGDWRSAGTVKRGYELNVPLIGRVAAKHSGSLASESSMLSISAPNVVVTAFKKAEDDDSMILRFYETDGKDCTANIKIDLPFKSYVETNLMEQPAGPKNFAKNGSFSAHVGKYEIKTIKLMR